MRPLARRSTPQTVAFDSHFVEEEGPPPAPRELLGDDLVIGGEVRLAARAHPHLRPVQVAVRLAMEVGRFCQDGNETKMSTLFDTTRDRGCAGSYRALLPSQPRTA